MPNEMLQGQAGHCAGKRQPAPTPGFADVRAGDFVEHDSTLSGVRALLGRNLKAARLGAGLSQQELALRAGVAPSLLVQVESGCGNPDIDTLGALARAVGRAAFELLEA